MQEEVKPEIFFSDLDPRFRIRQSAVTDIPPSPAFIKA